MTRRGTLLFAAMCLIWGVPYLLIKIAVRDFTPGTLVFFRTAIGSLILFPLAAGRGRLAPLLAHWRPVVAYTIVELAIPWVLLSTAEQRLPSSLSGLLVAAVPMIGVTVSWFAGRRGILGPGGLVGLAVGLAGVGTLVGFDVSGADAGSTAMLAVVVLGYAVGPLIVAHYLADLPGLSVVTASLVLCGLTYAPYGLTHLPTAMPPWRVWASVAVLGVVCTALAFAVFFHLIAEVGPVKATVITYVNPAVAVVLGVTFLDEHFGAGTALGFALILVGSVLATRPRLGRAPAGLEAVEVAEP